MQTDLESPRQRGAYREMKYLLLLLLIPSCSTPQPAQPGKYNLSHFRAITERMTPEYKTSRWSLHPQPDGRIAMWQVYEIGDLNEDWYRDMRDIAELQNYFGGAE